MTLQYHARPIRKIDPTKYTRGKATPYHFSRGEAGKWRIGFGASSFLVAEGPANSLPVGRRLFRDLEDDWLLRPGGKNTRRRPQ